MTTLAHYVPRMVLSAAAQHLRASGRRCDVLAASPEAQQDRTAFMRPFTQADGSVVWRCVGLRS